MESIAIAIGVAAQIAAIQSWEQHGHSADCKHEFVDTAIEHISSLKDLEEKLSDVGSKARVVDDTFEEICQGFRDTEKSLASVPGIFFPFNFISPQELRRHGDRIMSYRVRWEELLKASCRIGYENREVLKSFDQVYLEKVENIKTDADRLEAIRALKEFTNTDRDHSGEMSRSFLDFKRDFAYSVDEFGTWLSGQGVFASQVARDAKAKIDRLHAEVEEFDRQIREAKGSLAIAGNGFHFIAIGAFPNIVGLLQMMRDNKLQELRNAQQSLHSWEQQPVLRLKARLDCWRPELHLVCQELIFFSEIWSCIRSQAVQFCSHIEGGLDVATNIRFKKEVRLARAICGPLMDGLGRYMEQLENHHRYGPFAPVCFVGGTILGISI